MVNIHDDESELRSAGDEARLNDSGYGLRRVKRVGCCQARSYHDDAVEAGAPTTVVGQRVVDDRKGIFFILTN
jgi:hypothetical protein